MLRPDISTLLKPALVAARTPAQHWTLAAQLREVADLVERTGAAIERNNTRPAHERVTRSGAAHRGGRPGARHVYLIETIRRDQDATHLTLRIGRAVFDDLLTQIDCDTAHARMSFHLLLFVEADQMVLVAHRDGYAVQVSPSGITMTVSGMAEDLIGVERNTRFAASVSRGSIYVDLRMGA